MPVTITLDTWEGSQLESTVGGVDVLSRNGIAEGISADVDADPSALFTAKDNILNELGGVRHPSKPNLSLTKIIINSISANSARFQLIYESFQGLQPSTYVIRYTAYAATRTTNLVPGTRRPIKVGYEKTTLVANPGGNSGTHPVTVKIPDDYVTMTFNMPMIGLEISGVVYGNPDNSKADGTCYVNDARWPLNVNGITPRNIGYWLMNKFETAKSVYNGYFSFSMQAACRVIEDWSETAVLRSSLTGKFAVVDDAAITAMNAKQYAYGIIYPTTSAEMKNGIARCGGNPTASFRTLFGIG